MARGGATGEQHRSTPSSSTQQHNEASRSTRAHRHTNVLHMHCARVTYVRTGLEMVRLPVGVQACFVAPPLSVPAMAPGRQPWPLHSARVTSVSRRALCLKNKLQRCAMSAGSSLSCISAAAIPTGSISTGSPDWLAGNPSSFTANIVSLATQPRRPAGGGRAVVVRVRATFGPKVSMRVHT